MAAHPANDSSQTTVGIWKTPGLLKSSIRLDLPSHQSSRPFAIATPHGVKRELLGLNRRDWNLGFANENCGSRWSYEGNQSGYLGGFGKANMSVLAPKKRECHCPKQCYHGGVKSLGIVIDNWRYQAITAMRGIVILTTPESRPWEMWPTTHGVNIGLGPSWVGFYVLILFHN